ncbi:anti-sigma factor, partial [Streptosporangium sp. OZ121]|uniref:anti-sigma factor n=1 Tax=Streptosporangium sp. OZ121 TaxID=3444183 RepID=UPI003F79C11A
LVGVVAVVAVVVGFVVGVSVADRSGVPDRVVAVVGTSLAPGVSGRVRVRETGSGVELVVRVRGLPPVGPDRYYQGWVRGGSEAVAVGTFHGRGGAEPVVLWSGVGVEDYPVMTITVQRRGAGPGSSGQVVATARLGP